MRVHTPLPILQKPHMPPSVPTVRHARLSPNLQMQMTHARDAAKPFVIVAKPPNQLPTLHALALFHDYIAKMPIKDNHTLPVDPRAVIHHHSRAPTRADFDIQNLATRNRDDWLAVRARDIDPLMPRRPSQPIHTLHAFVFRCDWWRTLGHHNFNGLRIPCRRKTQTDQSGHNLKLHAQLHLSLKTLKLTQH
jgi:hypothetical protein